jgi:hypothetical protein
MGTCTVAPNCNAQESAGERRVEHRRRVGARVRVVGVRQGRAAFALRAEAGRELKRVAFVIPSTAPLAGHRGDELVRPHRAANRRRAHRRDIAVPYRAHPRRERGRVVAGDPKDGLGARPRSRDFTPIPKGAQLDRSDEQASQDHGSPIPVLTKSSPLPSSLRSACILTLSAARANSAHSDPAPRTSTPTNTIRLTLPAVIDRRLRPQPIAYSPISLPRISFMSGEHGTGGLAGFIGGQGIPRKCTCSGKKATISRDRAWSGRCVRIVSACEMAAAPLNRSSG